MTAVPHVGLSLMVEDDFARASLPLFEASLVDCLEWTVEAGWRDSGIPDWLEGLLEFYGESKRLSGHGLSYSPLSADGGHERDAWLDRLKDETARRKYVHFSEHFGFMRAGAFVDGAPLPVPFTEEALRVGRESMSLLKEAAGVPVGLENLAFAFGLNDVRNQGEFIKRLLEPVNGFLLLDVHNLFCQSVNFEIPFFDLIDSYPLSKVRQLHVSGGSTSHSRFGLTTKPLRRDTHDGKVPDEIFQLIPQVLKLCPNVSTVIFERLGNTLSQKSDCDRFALDFRRLRQICTRELESIEP